MRVSTVISTYPLESVDLARLDFDGLMRIWAKMPDRSLIDLTFTCSDRYLIIVSYDDSDSDLAHYLECLIEVL
jgi:hypothetical protein